MNDPEASKYVLLSSKDTFGVDTDRDLLSHHQSCADLDYSDAESDDLPPLLAQDQSTTSSSNNSSSVKSVSRSLINEFGTEDDGYDYSKHLREMGRFKMARNTIIVAYICEKPIGNGVFYSSSGRFESNDVFTRKTNLPEDVLPSLKETDRLLESITLTTGLMTAMDFV